MKTENIIEIKFGDYFARINISRGANCIELKNKKYNADILRVPDYRKESDNPYVYGMPILYPVNRIENGKFLFEDSEYTFPINEKNTNCHLHGTLHRMPFAVLKKGDNFVSCVYDLNDDYLGFPHKFRIIITYSLSEKGLMQETEIFNLSDSNMPNFLGFHTTFNLPFTKNSSVSDIRIHTQIGEEIERDMSVYLPTGKLLPQDEITRQLKNGSFKPDENKISRHYKSDGDGIIELIDDENGLVVVYENDKKFKFRLFYNADAEDYICLEPMTCMANCQNSPFERDYAGFDYIAPHSSKKYVSKIYLEEMKNENHMVGTGRIAF